MKRIADGVFQFTLPMPMALKEVHVYALEADGEWILVDSGFPSIEARNILQTELEALIGNLARVSTIIVTHFHPDHSGLAGWFQEVTGCRVVLHRADWPYLARMAAGQPPPEDRFAALARRSSAELAQMRSLFGGVSNPLVTPELVDGSKDLLVNSREIKLVWTPGHTEGHLCVLDHASGILFTGDHVLARITPHIGSFGGSVRNPLHDFEASLKLVEQMAPRFAFPAHERSIEDPALRCRELLEHHRLRRERIMDEIGGMRKSVRQIAEVLFRNREGEFHQMLALSESQAHLDALVFEGVLERVGDSDVYYQR